MSTIQKIISALEPKLITEVERINKAKGTAMRADKVMAALEGLGDIIHQIAGEDSSFVLTILEDSDLCDKLVAETVSSYYETMYVDPGTKHFATLGAISLDYSTALLKYLGGVILFAPMIVKEHNADTCTLQFDMHEVMHLDKMGDKRGTKAERKIISHIFQGLSQVTIPLPVTGELDSYVKTTSLCLDSDYNLIIEGPADFLIAINKVRAHDIGEKHLKEALAESAKDKSDTTTSDPVIII